MSSDDMLNSEAAAKYLGYHVGYLRLLCREGQIRYTKNNGYRFEQAWLDAFLATRQPERVAARAPRPSFKKPGRPPAVGPLSVKDVEEIRNRLLTGQSPAQIAREFVMGDERENP